MTTVDRLNRSFDNVGDAQQLRDYKGALSAVSGYVGTFRADDPNLVVQASGAISELRDWDTTRKLVQPTAAYRPTRVYDAELGRSVIRLDKAATQFMTLAGAGFDATQGWMIAALIKTDADLTGIQNVAGIAAGPPDTQTAGIQLRGTSLTVSMNGISAPLIDANQIHRRWTSVIASYGGNGGTFLEVNGQTALYDPSTPVSEPTGSPPFLLGSQFFPFGGYVDSLVVANFPFHASGNTSVQSLVRAYLAARLS